MLGIMPKLAANLSTLFKEREFLDRFGAAARAGFGAVEYQYPYDFKPADIAAAASEAGVEVVLHNMPRGDLDRGEHGTACLPGREQRFREDLERAIGYAKAVGCERLHCMAGVMPAGSDKAELHAVYVANIRYAGKRLAAEGMQVLIEPLSAGTIAGCFLSASSQAAQIVEEVDAANVRVQYDLFHMARLLPVIGHMQVADVPGRHEPGSGEINFGFLLPHIDRLGYSGWIGCEYNPEGDTLEGLKWARPYLRNGST
jgi:hydroxypyruvate isomerase